MSLQKLNAGVINVTIKTPEVTLADLLCLLAQSVSLRVIVDADLKQRRRSAKVTGDKMQEKSCSMSMRHLI